METTEDQEETLHSSGSVYIIATLAGGHSIVHWFTQAFPLLLAEVVTTLGLSPLAAGTIMGARNLSGAVVNIPMGVAADRLSHRRKQFMTAAILWFGGSYFLLGVAPNLPLFVAAAVVLGAGGALWHPSAIGMLSNRFPERRASVIALHGVGASAGDIAGPLLIGGLLVVTSWENIFRFSPIPVIVLATGFYLLMRGVDVGGSSGHTSLNDYFSALAKTARYRPMLLSLLAGGTRNAAQVVLMTFLPIYARDELGFSTGIVGVLLALLLGLSLVSQPVLGYLSDRTNRKAVILPGAVILTVVTPMLGIITGVWALVVVVSVIGLFMFSMAVLLGALGLDIAPPELHSSVTAAQFVTGLGLGSIAPVVAGAIANAGGIEGAFYFATGLFAVTLVLVLMLPNTKGTRPTPRYAAG